MPLAWVFLLFFQTLQKGFGLKRKEEDKKKVGLKIRTAIQH